LDKEGVGRQGRRGRGIDEREIKALLLESDSEISHVTGSVFLIFLIFE